MTMIQMTEELLNRGFDNNEYLKGENIKPMVNNESIRLGDVTFTFNGDGSSSMCIEGSKSAYSISPFDIKKVIFNEPATIVFWADGTKTIVKCQEWDEFIPETGLAMAIAKKAYGNVGHYYETIKKWTDPYYEEQAKMYEEFRESIIEAEVEGAEEEPVWWIWVEMVGLDKAVYFKHEEKSYKRKCDATRVAKKNYGDSTKYNFIVSQENPWL